MLAVEPLAILTNPKHLVHFASSCIARWLQLPCVADHSFRGILPALESPGLRLYPRPCPFPPPSVEALPESFVALQKQGRIIALCCPFSSGKLIGFSILVGILFLHKQGDSEDDLSQTRCKIRLASGPDLNQLAFLQSMEADSLDGKAYRCWCLGAFAFRAQHLCSKLTQPVGDRRHYKRSPNRERKRPPIIRRPSSLTMTANPQ